MLDRRTYAHEDVNVSGSSKPQPGRVIVLLDIEHNTLMLQTTYFADSSILVVDESRLNEVLETHGGRAAGLIVILNNSASSNQDRGHWNPSGSGSMWTDFKVPIEAASNSDDAYIAGLAMQNSGQVWLRPLLQPPICTEKQIILGRVISPVSQIPFSEKHAR